MDRREEARSAWESAVERMEDAASQLAALSDDAEPDLVEVLEERFRESEADAEKCKHNLDRLERIARARQATMTAEPTDEHEDDVQPERRRAPAPTPRVSVGKEPLTYDRRNRNGSYYFRDLMHASLQHDMGAIGRLQRHGREMLVEKRALSSTDGVGGDFVPPLWMMEEWTNVIRMGRPFANSVNNAGAPPPNTDTISIPRLLTGTATSAQADGGAVQNTDATTGQLAVPVKTIAGMQDLARQLIDRSQPGMDEILFQDLVADYNLRLDLQALSGSGSGANAKGILTDANTLAVTYTQATPAVGGAGGFYAKVADAVQQIVTNRGLPPDTICMHPRRWGWITASSDTTNRPLVPVGMSTDDPTVGVAGGINQLGNVGFQIQGLSVVVDANLPTNLGAGTNQDPVIVYRAQDEYLWEDGAPKTRVFEQTNSTNLQVRLQIWNYFAFTSERYSKAAAVINGTGTIAPTF
jgi:HK97 family phage major capsid protein